MLKRIAILGDPNSIWIKTYVREVLMYMDIEEIFIFSDRKYDLEKKDPYSSKVHIIACESGKISFLLDFYFKYAKIGKFDYLHIHFVNKRKLIASRLVRNKTKKVVVTFWGSDLLRKNPKELRSYEKYLKRIDQITIGSNDMKVFFERFFSGPITRKVSVIRFGVNGIEPIYQIRVNKNQLKEKWGIPLDKKVITVGYNGSERQNHIDVINSISKICNLMKSDIYLLLPMTYGLTSQYLSKVQEKLNQTDIKYNILTDYLSSNQVAEICSITDFFVHAQDTDAFSASVQEYLCAGIILLNPSWITYNELIADDVKFWEYHSFDDLTKKLQDLITNGITDDDKQRLLLNKEKIYKLSSWSFLREKWIEVYD